MNSVLLEFSGKIQDEELYLYLKENLHNSEFSERQLLKILQKKSKYISYKIKSDIIKNTGINCDAVVSFNEGCIEWNGFVEIYKSLEFLATIGGAVGFVQLVKASINSTIADSFRDSVPKIYNSNKKQKIRIEPNFDINTEVKNVTSITDKANDHKETYEPTQKNEIRIKEKDSNLLYLVLILSIISNVVAFVALALSLS